MLPALRVLILGAALVGAPLLGGTSSALLALAASCAVAALVDERWSAWSAISGSLAALALVGLGADHPLLAGALWTAGVWSARALRGGDPWARRAVAVGALLGGGLGAAVAARSGGDASAVVRSAAVLVAGIVASAPSLVAVDDPVATALRWAASPRRELVDEQLARALDLRRRVALADAAPRLDADVAARVERAWSSLAELAGELAAARAKGAAPGWMAARVGAYVVALERAHERLDAHLASSVRVTDPRLAEVELASESLDAEIGALDELTREAAVPARRAPEISVP